MAYRYSDPARPEVIFSVECEPEECQIEGNASDIDEETDRETETWIREELEAGNEWAWCSVKVSATVRSRGFEFQGAAYLACCSYRGIDDFCTPDGYYPDMCQEALGELDEQIQSFLSGLTSETLIRELERRNVMIGEIISNMRRGLED